MIYKWYVWVWCGVCVLGSCVGIEVPSLLSLINDEVKYHSIICCFL